MNFYNDNSPESCTWLKELMKNGLLPKGIIDSRSINEIQPNNLFGFRQVHFFAGIGGWPRAFKLAGFTGEAWSGSCPCQPFSCAGKGLGEKDERHLWPEFRRLIDECRPPVVFGEQVASKAGRAWLSGVRADLEAMGYAVGAADLCAASVGAPHIRQRLYWGAVRLEIPSGVGWGGRSDGISSRGRCSVQTKRYGRLGIPNGSGSQPGDSTAEAARYGNPAESASCRVDGMANADRKGPPDDEQAEIGRETGSIAERNCWSDSTPILCRDGKIRRIPSQSSFQRMVDGLSVRVDCEWTQRALRSYPLSPRHAWQGSRVGLLKGYGNAIVPKLAAKFIKAFIHCI